MPRYLEPGPGEGNDMETLIDRLIASDLFMAWQYWATTTCQERSLSMPHIYIKDNAAVSERICIIWSDNDMLSSTSAC